MYVIAQDQTAQMRTVTVVQTQEQRSLIDSGIEKGERVVIDGQYKLQPGAPVEITQPGPKPGAPGQPGGRPGRGQRPPGGKPGPPAGEEPEKKSATSDGAAAAPDGKEPAAGSTRFRVNRPEAP